MGVIRKWWKFSKAHPLQGALICMFLWVAIVWGGENGGKGSGPSVIQKGIKIKAAEITPTGISMEWEAEDDRISPDAEYIIEYRKKWLMLGDTIVDRDEDMTWREFGRTKNKGFAKECWLLDSTFDIRVRTVIQEGVTE